MIWCARKQCFPSYCHQEEQETLLLEKGKKKSINSGKWLHLAKLYLCLTASGAAGGCTVSVRSRDTVAWSRAQDHAPVYRSALSAHNEHCQSLFPPVRCLSPLLGKSPSLSFSHGLQHGDAAAEGQAM